MRQSAQHSLALRATTFLGVVTLLAVMTACDGCKAEQEKKDAGVPSVASVDMRPAKAPDMKAPLAEAREQADKLGVSTAMERFDVASLTAADIEGATKEVDTKTSPPRTGSSSRPKGKLPNKDVARVFRKFDRAMKMCYERALKKSPGLEGRVGLTVVVGKDGLVKRANARGLSLKSRLVTDCMENLTGRMKFPKPTGGDAQVNKTYRFEPAL